MGVLNSSPSHDNEFEVSNSNLIEIENMGSYLMSAEEKREQLLGRFAVEAIIEEEDMTISSCRSCSPKRERMNNICSPSHNTQWQATNTSDGYLSCPLVSEPGVDVSQNHLQT